MAKNNSTIFCFKGSGCEINFFAEWVSKKCLKNITKFKRKGAVH